MERVYEPYPERQIREAMERGEFADLPGEGRPIADLDDDPAWWARRYVEYQRRLDRAHAEARRVDTELGSLWLLATETAVAARVAELNGSLFALNLELRASDRVEPLDLATVVVSWRRMAAARRLRV